MHAFLDHISGACVCVRGGGGEGSEPLCASMCACDVRVRVF